MATKIDDLLADSENLLHESNLERFKMAEGVLSTIVEKARKESERLQSQRHSLGGHKLVQSCWNSWNNT